MYVYIPIYIIFFCKLFRIVLSSMATFFFFCIYRLFWRRIDIFKNRVFPSRSRIFFFFFGLFRATPVAYGGSQARGRIGTTAAGLHHSYSNARSKLHL